MSGILITLDPILLRSPFVTVRWYGVLLVVAILVATGVAIRRAARTGIDRRQLIDLASWALLSGLVGARVGHLLEHWDFYLTRPDAMLDLSAGGLSGWGGYVLGGFVTWRVARRMGLPVARLADALALALPLGDALSQLACFVNGDGQGIPSGLPWATHYRSSDAMTPDFGIPRHPVQLYQGVVDLIVLSIVLAVPANWPSGSRFLVWLGLFGLGRLVLGELGLDPRLLFGLQAAQILGLTATLAAAWAIIRLCRAVGSEPRHSISV